MTSRYSYHDEFELDDHTSDSFDVDEEDYEAQSLTRRDGAKYAKRARWTDRLRRYLPLWTHKAFERASVFTRARLKRGTGKLRRKSVLGRFCFSLRVIVLVLLSSIIFTFLFRPSYTRPPTLYREIRKWAKTSEEDGRANPNKEKIFIAASIYDPEGELVTRHWKDSVLGLINLLGIQNVFLSVYENDAGNFAEAALVSFENEVKCDHEIIFEKHLDPKAISNVTLPTGEVRVKRMAYLAEVRNRALRPLDKTNTKYDKVLFLNDVIFDPVEAAQLLFATNVNKEGRADYRAACAVDFINAFKFYDTFATRDLEGYSMGIPFYPWFTTTGHGRSRQDVLDQKDAVRVRSCWGGMVAFDAKFLQAKYDDIANLNVAGERLELAKTFKGFRFRHETDLYWDASECCLIHADIQGPSPEFDGIYMNPYIRVAYDAKTLSWLHFTRRFERLYSPVHNILNHYVGLPWYNPRRAEAPGSLVTEKVWVANESGVGGSFQMVERLANHAEFCGTRQLQVLKENTAPGEKPWEILPAPG